jgi:hypothetical protein
MKVEVFHNSDNTSVEARTIPRREDFGTGRLGQMAYNYVLNGEPCYTLLDSGEADKLPARCGRPSIGTLDYDDFQRQVDQVPICSDEHLKKTRDELEAMYVKSGRTWWFGINGKGREDYSY